MLRGEDLPRGEGLPLPPPPLPLLSLPQAICPDRAPVELVLHLEDVFRVQKKGGGGGGVIFFLLSAPLLTPAENKS